LWESETSMELPQEVKELAKALKEAGFSAYLVGGCVRDFLMGENPKDWDIATSAKPKDIQEIFPESVYENEFGTVLVKTGSEEEGLDIVEVTTFRKENSYSDHRHPDAVEFTDTIEEDLSRRDFTMNAIALDIVSDEQIIIDPYGGQADIRAGIIKAVGSPEDRFGEDSLRMMRAVRFAARFGFDIEAKTKKAIQKQAETLAEIAPERIRDELIKLLMTDGAGGGIRLMSEVGLLEQVIPELQEGVGMEQNKHHIYTVFEHNVRALEYAVEKGFPLHLRISSLLHDIGKVGTREWKDDPRGDRTKKGKKGDWTFYQHQYLGEKIVKEVMNRLKFPKEMIKKVALLVREHMFVYDPEVVTEKGVRRLLRRVGVENIDDLVKLREADRIGSGVPKAQPYRLRDLQAKIEMAKKEPVGVKQLKIDGKVLMNEVGMKPGPQMGYVLAILLEEVLDSPELNTEEALLKRARELMEMDENKLKKMADKAKEMAREAQDRLDDAIKEKYFVK